jgi:hypothetical protein
LSGPAEPEPAEPRFAGSVPWVPAEPTPTLPPLTPTIAPPPVDSPPVELTPLSPVVEYGPGSEPELPLIYAVSVWVPSALAIAGGLLAAISSLLTWATLELVAQSPDTTINNDSVSTIKYNGLSLLEGRVALIFGIAAIVLGILGLSGILGRKALAGCLCALGAVAILAVGFAAVGHPVELATLFRTYRQIDSVRVSLPDGVGVWLALGGGALILISGLLARVNQAEGRG